MNVTGLPPPSRLPDTNPSDYLRCLMVLLLMTLFSRSVHVEAFSRPLHWSNAQVVDDLQLKVTYYC
jgi:hypothetical protein